MLPVDIVSEAIVKMSIFHGSNGQSYNISNPKTITWKEYINLVSQNGYPIQSIDVKDWINNYILELDESSSFYPLKGLYLNPPEFKDKNVEYGVTQRVLGKVGIQLPKNYQSMVSFYIKSLENKGFLPKHANA